jgi:hypothetical protein
VQLSRQRALVTQTRSDFYAEQKLHELMARSAERAGPRAAAREAAEAEHARHEAAQALAAQASRDARLAATSLAHATEQEHAAEIQASLRQTKLRQAIIDASPEVRALKARVEAVQVQRTRDLQIEAFSEALRDVEIKDAAFESAMAQARAEEIKRAELAVWAKHHAASGARAALIAQIQERDMLLQAAKEEMAKDRGAMEELMQRCAAEDGARAQANAERKRAMAADAAHFVALQRELKQRRKKAEAEEERKIQEYLRVRRERAEAELVRQANVRRGMDLQFEEARRVAEEAAAKREEEEALLDMLRAEMESQRLTIAEEEATTRRHRIQSELLEARDHMLRMKAERQAEEKAREVEFRQRLLDRLAEEDRIDSMALAARKGALADHLREAQRCIDYRRALAEAVKKEEAEEARKVAEREAHRAAVIEEERQRLVTEAADALQRSTLARWNDPPNT